MPFNGEVLRALREKYGMKRTVLAAILGLSYGGLYKYETGAREPRREFVEEAAFLFDVSIDTFFDISDYAPDFSGISVRARNLLELTARLDKERFDKKRKELRIAELEKQHEHLLSVYELQTRHAEILRLDLPRAERGKRLANLVRDTAAVGEICFDEIAETLKVDRPTLRRWLGSKESIYACRLSEEKTVEAYTPDEAGVRLQCFDCENKASGDCKGYGNTASPEDFFALIALLEANGIDDREEQARLLHESYNMELTAHQISEYLSREKSGKTIPPDIVNLQPHKRK